MRKSALFAVLIAVAIAAPVVAQDGNPYAFAITGGIGFPTSSGYKDLYKSGIAAGASFAGPISGGIDWRIDAGYNHFTTDSGFEEACEFLGIDCDSHFDGWHLTGGLQVHGNAEASFVPYAFAGAGMYHTSNVAFVVDEEVFSASESGSDFGLGFGLGFDYKAGESWGVRVEGRMDGVLRGEHQDVWSISPMAGVFFRF